MRVDDFTDLIAWQLADELRHEILEFTETGPAARDFKYRDQIRDAIRSACRNTSEGFKRFRPAEFARFLEFAQGSLAEAQDCLIDGRDQKYIDDRGFERMWRLSKRALAANTSLFKYLRWCVETGRQPWVTGSADPRGNGEPESSEPQNSEPENLEP